jgi:hypothetical protein
MDSSTTSGKALQPGSGQALLSAQSDDQTKGMFDSAVCKNDKLHGRKNGEIWLLNYRSA